MEGKLYFHRELFRPAMLGLMDGTVSTLAPIFAAAQVTDSVRVFAIGLAASTGAGLSMGLAEALSHRQEERSTVPAWIKGVYTGVGTGLGGTFHTLPFLLPDMASALYVAYAVVGIELTVISYVRWRWLGYPVTQTVALVIGGGGLVFFLGIFLGRMVPSM